jgi:hypothetical protein
MIKYGALTKLVDILRQDSLSTQQVALFSLGTFCQYPEFHETLNKLQLPQLIQENFSSSQDPTIQKYVKRITESLCK